MTVVGRSRKTPAGCRGRARDRSLLHELPAAIEQGFLVAGEQIGQGAVLLQKQIKRVGVSMIRIRDSRKPPRR